MINQTQISDLRDRWKKLCQKNYNEMGDAGTSVIGAGLKEGDRDLISVHEVSPGQGCLVWETGLDELLADFNREHKLKIYYDCGSAN